MKNQGASMSPKHSDTFVDKRVTCLLTIIIAQVYG